MKKVIIFVVAITLILSISYVWAALTSYRFDPDSDLCKLLCLPENAGIPLDYCRVYYSGETYVGYECVYAGYM